MMMNELQSTTYEENRQSLNNKRFDQKTTQKAFSAELNIAKITC